MSKLPSISDYITSLGSLSKNQQKLLGYYSELYEFYNDKRPDNKYIYYLDENPYLEPAQTMTPETLKFFSANPLQLSLMNPSIKIFKVFQSKGNKKRIQFPFENKMDYDSFKDPIKYIGEQTPFIAERFMGPLVGLKDLNISFKGLGGKGATPATLTNVVVNLSMDFQDVKMLFKNLDDEGNVKYKDLFASPSKANYRIVIEIGYGIPDNLDLDLEQMSKRKLILNLFPNGAKTNITYNENGSADLSTTLEGFSETVGQSFNLLDPKYYKEIRKSTNMLVMDKEEQFSPEELNKKRDDLDELIRKREIDKQLAASKAISDDQKPDQKKSKGAIKKLEKEIKNLEVRAQLARQAKSIPPVFSFVSALYELNKVYYLEMDNELYKRYIRKIAQGEPVEVSTLKVIPEESKKIKLAPPDILDKAAPNAVLFNGGSFRIRKFSGKASDTDSSFEKIKYFYFGDLLNIILNNQAGTGVGQDLDDLGDDAFNILLGPTVFIQNKNTKKIYNMANVPISLDMFLFELNKLIVSDNLKFMSLRQFLSDFMKRFFDLNVLAGEKEKTGKDLQFYAGSQVYTLDDKTIDKETKTIKNFADHMGAEGTTKIKDFLLIKNILYDKRVSKKKRKKLNIPTIFLGGPDKGPLKSISYQPIQLKGLAALAISQQYNLTKGDQDSIGDADEDSILITSKMAASLSLKGNPFLNLNDKVFIDSRFVDGGFFQQKNNNLFFSGLFYVHALAHSIQGNEWVTNYELLYTGELETQTYTSTPYTVPPAPQNAALLEEAKNNTTGAPNKKAAPKDAKKKKPNKKKSKSSSSKANKPKKPTKPVTAKSATAKEIEKKEIQEFNQAESERYASGEYNT